MYRLVNWIELEKCPSDGHLRGNGWFGMATGWSVWPIWFACDHNGEKENNLSWKLWLDQILICRGQRYNRWPLLSLELRTRKAEADCWAERADLIKLTTIQMIFSSPSFRYCAIQSDWAIISCSSLSLCFSNANSILANPFNISIGFPFFPLR